MNTIATDTAQSVAQLRLMHLISPSLPIGSFTYSQGMEWAIESGWITSASTLSQWLEEQINSTQAKVDLPLTLRLYDASKHEDIEKFKTWCEILIASRETSELRAEEHNRGRAMKQLLKSLDLPGTDEWFDVLSICQAAGFAHAAQVWNISREDMLLGYAWSWLENLVLAGIKIIPLGQSDGQKILHNLSPKLTSAINTAISLNDEEIGASNPAMSIASSQHQFQYTRLFRS